MRFARLNHTALLLSALLGLQLTLPASLQAAGVTLITHGNTGDTDGWVLGMANAFSERIGGNVPIYRFQVTTNNVGALETSIDKVSGAVYPSDPRGQIIVMLDWRPPVADGNSFTTLEVASVVAPLFTQTNVVGELGGGALAQLPIHLIGHSRGGSLICELSRLLGTAGVWVDHLTGLDTHPLNNDGFFDFIYSVVDPSARSYENTLFVESYYQTAAFFADGLIIPGSTWRRLTDFSGGYGGTDSSHSDVHLWYHGTVDLNTPTTDGDFSGGNPVTITTSMRDTWWTSFEQAGTNSGFIYSQLGGGDRLSTNQPNGADSSLILDGFNRYYDVGGGTGPTNRTPVGSNTGEWPNPIRFDLLTTNVVEQGDTATLEIYFQWAQPNTSTQAVQVLADPDRNPLNGNEILLDEGFATGTTVAQLSHGTIDAELDGAVINTGQYNLLVGMTASNRTRFLYASQSIQVSVSTQPLFLDITASTNSMFALGVNGVAGQTAVVEMSVDGLPWIPVATNTLNSSRWEIVEPVEPAFTKTLFRAVLVNP